MNNTSTDIVLINPPYNQIDEHSRYVRHITNRSPGMGLLQLAGQLREEGFQPAILECDLENLTMDRIIQRVRESGARFVGITLFTVGVHSAMDIASRLKKLDPQIKIITGGPHISSMAKVTLERFDVIDVAVLKEGDYILGKLLRAFRLQQDLNSIEGIMFRDGDGNLIQTKPAPQIQDMDSLPDPAWDLLPRFPWAYPSAIFNYPRGPVATMATSRGCPHACNFCDNSVFGQKIRSMSPPRIFQQMKKLYYDFGVRHIFFVDDLFVFHRNHIKQLTDLLIGEQMDLTWNCAARIEILNPDLLARMKKAGCWEISFGLESGSDEMLRKMNKNETTQKAKQVVQWTAEAGIRAKGLFMIGYPGETAETIEQTYQYIQKLPLSVLNVTRFTPYPGSRIYSDLFQSLIREDHWDSMNGMNFVKIESDGKSFRDISEEKLDHYYKKIVKDFYSQKRITHNYAKLAISNPEHLFRLIKFFGAYATAQFRKTLAHFQADKKSA